MTWFRLCGLVLVLAAVSPLARADQQVKNSKAVGKDAAKLKCVCDLLPCLPAKQRAATKKVKNTANFRHAPQADIDNRAVASGNQRGLIAITDINRGCVTISDDVFKNPPNIGLKKRVLIHEATHLGQGGEYGGFCGKIKRCFGHPINGRLSQTGKDLMSALEHYLEVGAGTETLPHLGGHPAAAKGEATYLASNLDKLCKALAKLAGNNDPKLDDEEVKRMIHSFKKCAAAGKRALDAYNANAPAADQVAVPASAAGK